MAGPRSLYGYELVSEFPLRRTLPVAGRRGRLELRRAPGPFALGEGTVVHAITSPAPFTLTRHGDLLHIACSASGQFLVDPAGVLLAAPSECDGDLWEHRLVTTAIPLLLAERGELVVHGAALQVAGRAIVLAGAAGRGKSTAALTAGALGYPLLGEDGAAIDLSGPEPVVWPGPLGVRVAPPGLGPKRTVLLPGAVHALEPVPLGVVVVLGDRGPELTVERIEPAAALSLVLPHLVYGGSDRLPVAFSQCARLVERAPVYRGSLPDGLDRLEEALAGLLRRVSSAEEPARR